MNTAVARRADYPTRYPVRENVRARSGPLAAFALFSALPMPRSQRTPGPHVLRYFPLVGLVLGGLGFVPALIVWRGGPVGSPTLGAVMVTFASVALTRGLHLRSLSGLSDAFASRTHAEHAREVMRQSEAGALGMLTLGLTLLMQVAALGTLFAASSRPAGLVGLLIAALTGRVAVICVSAFRAVPGGGLGTLVAGSIGSFGRAVTVGALVVAAEVGQLVTGAGAGQAIVGAVAVVLGIAVSTAVAQRAVRRLDGVTGDVFGAVVEVATTIVLVVLAVATTWY